MEKAIPKPAWRERWELTKGNSWYEKNVSWTKKSKQSICIHTTQIWNHMLQHLGFPKGSNITNSHSKSIESMTLFFIKLPLILPFRCNEWSSRRNRNELTWHFHEKKHQNFIQIWFLTVLHKNQCLCLFKLQFYSFLRSKFSCFDITRLFCFICWVRGGGSTF